MTKSKRFGPLVGIGIFLAGAAALFILMANEGRVARASLWGAFALLIAIVGLLKSLALPREADDPVVLFSATAWGRKENEPAWAAPKITVSIALVLLIALGVGLGLSKLPWAIGAFLLALAPSAFRRPGLAVFVIVSALYLPLLGVYGLWDPWETHYGEVAREMLSRDDWISLWWAQDGWFWSKPILIFWSSALSWSALGIPYRPGTFPTHVEWALRLPIYVMSVSALLAVYGAVARLFTRRAALLSALVLATTPHFFFLAHQAITDMPFVANLTIAMALLMTAVSEDPSRQVKSYRIGPFMLSAQQLVMAMLVAVALPQILYLASRNVTMVSGPLFEWHTDRFLHGSAGNGGVPGNEPLRPEHPHYNALWAQPIVQALLWLVGLSALIWKLRRERRAQALYMFAFYVFCALAVMAKGIPGIALPGIVALLYLLVSNRWSLLLEGRLRIAVGMTIVPVVAMPWFVAMYIRHGFGFTDRLLIHDHINRLASGVHGDTGSIQYFIAQFGYGVFPWIGLAPAALSVWWYWRHAGDTTSELELKRRQSTELLLLWFTAAFTLFSAMVTKFHHYIFPAEPPAAILIGLVLDRMLGAARINLSATRLVVGVGAIVIAPALCVLAIAGWVGDVRGITPKSLPLDQSGLWVLAHPWPSWVCLLLLLVGVVLALLSFKLIDLAPSAHDSTVDAKRPAVWATSLGAALVCGAIVCAYLGADLMMYTTARPVGYERLIHLFVYNYGRPWPMQFDYRPILTGFVCVATFGLLAASVPRVRALAARGLLGLALAFCLWCVDIYMIDLSPHWGQRELIEAYYRARKGPYEPLVAWQMNWKGENLYSGNRVSVFINLKDEDLVAWMDKQKGGRAFFVLEHSRLARFRSILNERPIREVTTARDNNKFILISARL